MRRLHHIIAKCVKSDIVTDEAVVSGGSFISANVAADSLIELKQEVEQSTVHYLDALDEELRWQSGYKEPTPTIKEKTVISSATDPDCGYINQEHKKGLGFLTEMTVDTENGIVVGIDCYPTNQRESNIILKHVKKIQSETGMNIKRLALDAGYDVGAVHRGLKILGITGYVSCIDFSYDILRRNLKYIPETDCFKYPAVKAFNFIKLTYHFIKIEDDMKHQCIRQ